MIFLHTIFALVWLAVIVIFFAMNWKANAPFSTWLKWTAWLCLWVLLASQYIPFLKGLGMIVGLIMYVIVLPGLAFNRALPL